MDLQLRDDVAVIVGGGSGIGRAIGQAFAAEGARVLLLDRDARVTQAAAEMADATSADVHGWVVDATDFAAQQETVTRIWETWQRCDHVVYAAGAGSGKFGFPYWNLDPSDWPRVLNVNLLGAVNMAHAFGPRMADARRGTMLFISSVAAQIGSQTDPPYSAAKAALSNFAECVAKDLAAFEVRVNTICPGMVQTPLNRSVWQAWHDQQPVEQRRSYDDWAGEKVRKIAPLGRWQTPEDMGSMAVFLASPLAKNITGQTLNVDGGQVMHW